MIAYVSVVRNEVRMGRYVVVEDDEGEREIYRVLFICD